jgi:hypothetical protein
MPSKDYTTYMKSIDKNKTKIKALSLIRAQFDLSQEEAIKYYQLIADDKNNPIIKSSLSWVNTPIVWSSTPFKPN